MKFFSKIAVVLLIILVIFYVKDRFFSDTKPEIQEEQVSSVEIPSDKIPEKKSEKKIYEKSLKIYYITTDSNGISVFKTVRRTPPSNVNNLKFALEELIKGPSPYEKKKGIFSEIPRGTKLLSVVESDKNIVVNLSSDFQYGGGTDSIYSRIRQLIKTVMATSPKKNVYLYLDGKEVDAIGGEGIMIEQPLSENSLHE